MAWGASGTPTSRLGSIDCGRNVSNNNCFVIYYLLVSGENKVPSRNSGGIVMERTGPSLSPLSYFSISISLWTYLLSACSCLAPHIYSPSYHNLSPVLFSISSCALGQYPFALTHDKERFPYRNTHY